MLACRSPSSDVGSGLRYKPTLVCSPDLVPAASVELSPETTGFKGLIFADPTRALYHALGMDIERLAVTPAGEQKRSYLTTGRLTNAVSSFWVR